MDCCLTLQSKKATDRSSASFDRLMFLAEAHRIVAPAIVIIGEVAAYGIAEVEDNRHTPSKYTKP